MRKIAVVTVNRSDYGIYLPLLRAIQSDAEFQLDLIVSGSHLLHDYGFTVGDIHKDGFQIGQQIPLNLHSDTALSTGLAMGVATGEFARAYEKIKPDVLVLLGDRYEMHSAAVASVPFNIPVAHIHGGESTEGAIDEQFRHSITKMAHIHFASTDEYARRIIQMGEEPWRVTVSGAPGLDNIRDVVFFKPAELSDQLGIDLSDPTLLVTYHPVTLELNQTEGQITELLAAFNCWKYNVLFTYPNVDPSNRVIIEMIDRATYGNNRFRNVPNLGTRAYLSLLKLVTAMVGNSSSGIIEAASFKLPVVNIGTRQQGRLRGVNVIDVGYDRNEIILAIEKAVSPQFRATLSKIGNLYGDGYATDRIMNILKNVPIDEKLLLKRFHEIK